MFKFIHYSSVLFKKKFCFNCKFLFFLLWGFIIVCAFCSVEANMASLQPVLETTSTAETSLPISIIPRPMKMFVAEGAFVLKPDTVILAGAGVNLEASYLAEILAPATGFKLQVKDLSGLSTPPNSIVLKLDTSLQRLGAEGYTLHIDKERINISALKPAGIFYACQTLRQLLPEKIFSKTKVTDVEWAIPCVTIEDKPRFGWRGQLLDCCRHFFSVDTIKRTIDLLALHKMNRLHWHLTEDQGWRLEIKRYPALTEIGAWRINKDGKRYGGFYTQEEVREIVAYAAARHITVVPEIEMPGHSVAALASYPELGCTGGPYTVANEWGVFEDVYCAGNETVFTFIENVLDEVMMLFPSQYIHIGGDECPKERWKKCPRCQARIKAENLKDEHELQSYFIKRIDAYLTSKGRQLIGWDEILEGGLAPNAIVQSWRGVKGGIAAASQGHDVIMSPTSHCYLDYSYAGIPLEKAYSFEPVPEELTPEQTRHILGLEGNLWSERVPNQDRLDFQVYPRLCALAEVAWSPKELRDWGNFSKRMEVHFRRLDILGVKYGYDELGNALKDAVVVARWTPEQMKKEGVILEWDISNFITEPGKYEAIFMYTRGNAALQIEWAALMENNQELQRDTHDGWSGYDKRDVIYRLSLPEYKPGAKYSIRIFAKPAGGTDSTGEVYLKKVK